MSYDKKYKERAVLCRMTGKTLEETSKIFQIGTTTLKRWEKEYKNTGDLSKKPLKRNPKKVFSEKLIDYVRTHPDAYQTEISEVFGCSQSAVCQAMKKSKITRKKRRFGTESKTQ